MKLPDKWCISIEEADFVKIAKEDEVHELPITEIYVDDSLGFTVRVFGWLLPVDHEIYFENRRSMKNVTLSNLIKLLECQQICSGLDHKVAVKASFQLLKHCAAEKFSLFGDEPHQPLTETVFFRPPSCEVMLSAVIDNKCNECFRFQNKETKKFEKINKDELLPAKPNAPISNTNPAKIKLALQEYRLENKALKN